MLTHGLNTPGGGGLVAFELNSYQAIIVVVSFPLPTADRRWYLVENRGPVEGPYSFREVDLLARERSEHTIVEVFNVYTINMVYVMGKRLLKGPAAQQYVRQRLGSVLTLSN